MTSVTNYHTVEDTSVVTPAQTVVVSQSEDRIRVDKNYVKKRQGLLRVIEVVLSLVVFICACLAIRDNAVFYGCSVWAAVVGFFGMLFTGILLAMYCIQIPHKSPSVPWKTIETVHCAIWSVCFLVAGVTLTVVAENAITKPRISFYTSSYIGDKFTLSSDQTHLPPIPDEPGHKREWLLHKTTGNNDEFRAATAGAVFAFAVTLVFAVDTFWSNRDRARVASTKKQAKYGPAAV